MNKNTLPERLSFREAAFWIWKKETIDCITDDAVRQTLEWLYTAADDNVLKVWYMDWCNFRSTKGKICSTDKDPNEIYVKLPDLRRYLERLFDWLSGKTFYHRHFTYSDFFTAPRPYFDADNFAQYLFDHERYLNSRVEKNPSFSRQAWIPVIEDAISRLEVGIPEHVTLRELIHWTCGIEPDYVYNIGRYRPHYESFHSELMATGILLNFDPDLLGLYDKYIRMCNVAYTFEKCFPKNAIKGKILVEKLLEYKIIKENKDKPDGFIFTEGIENEVQLKEQLVDLEKDPAFKIYTPEPFTYIKIMDYLKNAYCHAEFQKLLDKTLDRVITKEDIIASAIAYNKILPEYLALIMAYENYPDDNLGKLLDRYLAKDDFEFTFNPEPDVSVPTDRIAIWYRLIYRFIGLSGLGHNVSIGPEDRLILASKTYEIKLTEVNKWINMLNDRCNITIPLPNNLFPENIRRFAHSRDYHSVTVRGRNYSLTSKQAQTIQILHEEHKNGTSEISTGTIAEELGYDLKEFRLKKDIFKGSEDAYEALIVPGEKKGSIRLNI